MKDENWLKIKITAEECPKIPADFLAEERTALGEWWYSQEYCCEFAANIDQYFTTEEIKAAFSDDVEPLF